MSKYPDEPRIPCILLTLEIPLKRFLSGDYQIPKSKPATVAVRQCAEWHEEDKLCLTAKSQGICKYKFTEGDLALTRPENFTYGGVHV